MKKQDVRDVELAHGDVFICNLLRARFSPQRTREAEDELNKRRDDLAKAVTEQRRIAKALQEETDGQSTPAEPTDGERLDLFDELTKLQNLTMGTHADVEQLKRLVEARERHQNENPAVLLRKIREIPAVTDIGLREGCVVCVRISVTYLYQDVTYDLGDWLIELIAYWHSQKVFNVKEVRSGLLDDVQSNEYPYYGWGSDVGYCFGMQNRRRIEQHLLHGDVVQAIVTIVSVMSHINVRDRAKVPQTFMPVHPSRLIPGKGEPCT